MERKQAATALFLLVLAGIAVYFCFLIIRPFLSPIFLAVMLAIVFHPAHVRIQARLRNRNRAALLSTTLVILAFVVPVVGLGVIVSHETTALYQFLNERSTEQGGWNPYLMHTMERLLHWVGQYVDLYRLDLRGTALRWLQQVSQYLFSWGAQVVGNFASFIANTVIAFFTLFFLFREGTKTKERAAELLPLTRSQVERLFTGVSNSIVANVYGVLAVAAAQGALTTLGFWVLSLSSPVLWGMVTALLSMVPIVGSAAVWVPAAIILGVSGHWIKAVILLGWGAAVVAQADNVIRPYIIGQRVSLSTLAVFFALLGGVKAFGVMGLFIGPVALSFTMVVLQMLRETILDHSDHSAA
jgi:predicted PurR-regulated permease PerM